MGHKETISIPKIILYIMSFLIIIGICMIYSASYPKALSMSSDPLLFVKKQLLATAIGFGLYFFILYLPTHYLKKLSWPLMVGSLVLLLLILVPGLYHKVGGAYRWIKVAGLSFQPSEVAKFSLIVFLSHQLSQPERSFYRSRLVTAISYILIASMLSMLLVQPDFGTMVLSVCVMIGMFYASGLSMRSIWFFIGSGAILGGCLIAFEPYRLRRVIGFLEPWEHVSTSGFQLIQSFLALKNGGLFGVGFGNSNQKLHFLPEAHTDFIFAVIGEELGVLGLVTITLMILNLILVGLFVSRRATDPFLQYAALGTSLMIGTQTFFNFGVTLGLLPTKGISLPFLSAGSSSLIVSMMLCAVMSKAASSTYKA